MRAMAAAACQQPNGIDGATGMQLRTGLSESSANAKLAPMVMWAPPAELAITFYCKTSRGATAVRQKPPRPQGVRERCFQW